MTAGSSCRSGRRWPTGESRCRRAYCGAKHAIQGFNESLRCELLHERSRVRTTMVQLPAVNTPQFSWVLSRLPRHAQPVPPIYQPEVAADAIVYAADHPRRREYWVGGSTAATLMANAVAPGMLDRYLARTGFRSQQTDQPRDPPTSRPTCGSRPTAARGHDFGAHGAFDEPANERSWQLWASQHHGLLAAAGRGGPLAMGRRAVRRYGGRRRLTEHWYDEAVIYCLDVETFADSDDDGVGDFRGLIGRLDYLYRLGVTCLWLNPIHPTPEPRRRLRRHRLLRRRPAARHSRRLRRAVARGGQPRHPGHHRSGRQPHLGPASVVPGSAASDRLAVPGLVRLVAAQAGGPLRRHRLPGRADRDVDRTTGGRRPGTTTGSTTSSRT